MPRKISDFIPFNYFSTFSGAKGLPIFHTFDFEPPEAEVDKKESADVSPNEIIDPDKESDYSAHNPRNFMLKDKLPEGGVYHKSLFKDRLNPEAFSSSPQNSFPKPEFYYYSSSGKSDNGEWKVETRIGSFSQEHFGSDFPDGSTPGSDLFGPSLGSDFFGSNFGSVFLGQNFGSDFFGPNLGSGFFGHDFSEEKSDSDLLDEGPPNSLFSAGPSDIFQHMFNMMRNLHLFVDPFDPFTEPPRR